MLPILTIAYMTCNPPDTAELSEEDNCYLKVNPEEMSNERRNGTDASETATSEGEQIDAARALAEAYVWIEYAEETVDEDIEHLETAKNSISELPITVSSDELERARRRLNEGDGGMV